jgi:hypothetical protein
MNADIIPSGPTIKVMKKEAEQCEQKARFAAEPTASTLREKAAVLREWIGLLQSRLWTS